MKQYLKGGIFQITYKVLALDLISQRIDPNLVTSVIFNISTGLKQLASDEFIVDLYCNQTFSGGRILFITDKPQLLTQDGAPELRRFVL